MHLLHVRMTAMDVAAIRTAVVAGSATLIEWTRRTALVGQAVVRTPHSRAARQDSGARRTRNDADQVGSAHGSNPWGGLTGHQMAIRESLAAGAAVPDDLARQYRVTPRTIKQIATHDTWKHVQGPKLASNWRPRTNTGYWGVTANGAGNRFSVSLYHDGRKYAFGWFKDVDEAARAYDAKARELRLPPERLNFPDED
jgi:hypothetical protein